MNDVELEHRLTRIEDLATRNLAQAEKTNGRVNRHGWLIPIAIGGLGVLAPVMGYLAVGELNDARAIAALQATQVTPEQITAATLTAMKTWEFSLSKE